MGTKKLVFQEKMQVDIINASDAATLLSLVKRDGIYSRYVAQVEEVCGKLSALSRMQNSIVP